ncbi:unnamed protein product [Dovyalis caffra]|uniref:Uncharacterized protein n=1 Tax=Dovyalis caffra TaxID=77055 RepID=A0AAV1S6Q4_9ROSI|nr:unnamed protein product [Dovyalis caffra]
MAKAFLAVVSGLAAVVFLGIVVHDQDNLFVADEAVGSIVMETIKTESILAWMMGFGAIVMGLWQSCTTSYEL